MADDAEMADAPAEPAVIKPLASSPFLLIDISTSQAQHGLRHGDHARYRQYCTNRLRRLYKALKFTHGTKTRYTPRKLLPQDVSDPRHLLIPLVNAERAWAYAMELKQAGDDPRKRHHLVQRLSKAAKWASELATLCNQVADARTALEAEGYSAWMSGTVLLEKGTDWGAALAKFLRAKAAFEQLEKVGSLEQSAVCRQRLGELEPSLRYCSYKGGNASASDLSSAFAAGTAGFDFLKDKLDAVAAEARLKVAAEVKSIPWRGLSLPVRSEATRVLLISASELVQQIEAAEVTGAASGERQMASFDKLLLALTDARRQVRMDLGAAAGEALISELRALDFAVTCMSLARTLQRNRLLLTTLQARWARQQQEEAEGGAAGAPAGKKAAGRGGKGGADRADEKPVRLQELVRLFDTVLGNVSEMAEVAGEAARTGGPAAEEAGKVARECAAEEALIRAERCALLARAQLVGAKFAEAAALFGRSAELAQRAAAALAASSSSSSAAAAGGKGKQQQGAGAEHQRLLALAESLGTSARKERCVAIVKGVSAQMAGRKAATSSLEKLSLDEVAQSQAAVQLQSDAGYVLEALDLYEAAAGAGVPEPKLARLPPALQPMPARPLFLDTALTAIEYPSLAHRVKASKEGRAAGIRSAVTSLFGWRS